jgi:hypothetical protein
MCTRIEGRRELRRMVSSEAKTLSLQRLALGCEASLGERRCNDSVFASLDDGALARQCRWARPIERFDAAAFVARRRGPGERRSNYALHRSVHAASLRLRPHCAAGELER